MRVLVLSMLYPTATAPHQAGFMPGRLGALAAHAEVTAVLPFPTVPAARLLRQALPPARFQGPGFEVYRPLMPVLPGLGRNRRPLAFQRAAWPTVARLHAAQPFDIVLGHFLFPDGVAAARIAERLGLPLVLVAHGSDVYQHAAIPARRRQIAVALAQAGALITVSRPLQQRLGDLGLPAEQAMVIPCGYDPAIFAPADRATARAALRLTDSPWLLFVGALRAIKRVDLVLEALAQLPDARLAIVGDGPEKARLAQHAWRLGLSQRLRLVGPQPPREVARWMTAADLLVLASDHEGTPTVMVEALATGLPVVATAVGGIPDLAGDTARLVAPGDPAALATAIAATLAAPPPVEALRVRVEGLSWPEVGVKEYQVLQTVLSC